MSDRGVVQVEVCVLDADWEPLRRITRQVGPFDDVEAVRADVEQAMAEWMQATGIQLSLL